MYWEWKRENNICNSFKCSNSSRGAQDFGGFRGGTQFFQIFIIFKIFFRTFLSIKTANWRLISTYHCHPYHHQPKLAKSLISSIISKWKCRLWAVFRQVSSWNCLLSLEQLQLIRVSDKMIRLKNRWKLLKISGISEHRTINVSEIPFSYKKSIFGYAATILKNRDVQVKNQKKNIFFLNFRNLLPCTQFTSSSDNDKRSLISKILW